MDTPDCIRELARKYSGTYFFFRKPGDTQESLVFCSNIEMAVDREQNIKGGVMTVDSLECGRLSFNIPSEHTMVFKIPPMGVWQFDKLAVAVVRYPARQWKRGTCQDNTSIQSTVSHLIPCDLRWSLELVDAVYKKKTFSVPDAFDLLDKKNYVSVAVGNGFSLCRQGTKDTYIVLYRQWPVALYHRGRGLSKVASGYESSLNKLFNGVH